MGPAMFCHWVRLWTRLDGGQLAEPGGQTVARQPLQQWLLLLAYGGEPWQVFHEAPISGPNA